MSGRENQQFRTKQNAGVNTPAFCFVLDLGKVYFFHLTVQPIPFVKLGSTGLPASRLSTAFSTYFTFTAFASSLLSSIAPIYFTTGTLPSRFKIKTCGVTFAP